MMDIETTLYFPCLIYDDHFEHLLQWVIISLEKLQEQYIWLSDSGGDHVKKWSVYVAASIKIVK